MGIAIPLWDTALYPFYVHDPYRHIVRPFLVADLRWLTTVLDALPNIDYV